MTSDQGAALVFVWDCVAAPWAEAPNGKASLIFSRWAASVR